MTGPPKRELVSLLDVHRETLGRLTRRMGGGLLRFESVDDLVQGVHLHAIKAADRFEYQGEAAFLGWLRRVARQHIADRHHYWTARKRDAGKLLRVTAGDLSSPSHPGGVNPPGSMTAPSSFAERREQLVCATQALDLLLPRDQQLVRWMSEGVSIAEMAERLEISGEAAERAKLRAVERFRKTYALVARSP